MINKDKFKKAFESPMPDRNMVKKIFKCSKCDRFKYDSEKERGSDVCSACAEKAKEMER